jgi:UDP-N-acetylmuramoyl-L-alanyl-D-glutamate--2,6-diaminopimelate ligase
MIKKLVPQKIKNIYHLCQAVLANLIYGFPSRHIKIIGITGTNGKTTTCQMIKAILDEAGFKTALASSLNFKIGREEWLNETKFTTLSSFYVQRFIKNAVAEKCGYLILEVSSHSLDQKRIWGINFETAVITNITREHLDYHKNMEKYRKAKCKLFKKARTAVINLDMENSKDFLDCPAEKKYGYATKNKKPDMENKNINFIKAENIKNGINGSDFKIDNFDFFIHLPGLFNVENALAAIGAGISQGIDLKIASRALVKISGVPGRFERVPNNLGIKIIIDYAVTPDSLEKLYSLIKEILKNGKIISVFGSCGERDRGKRPLMGSVVEKYADYIILTNEDPYHEDPWRIIDEIAKGINNKKENVNFWKIMDRREAIKKALRLTGPGDILVVTGKGVETSMAIGSKKVPWNDRQVIQELLRELE